MEKRLILETVSAALWGCVWMTQAVSHGAVCQRGRAAGTASCCCCEVWSRSPGTSRPPPARQCWQARANWAESSPYQHVKVLSACLAPCSSSLWDQMNECKRRWKGKSKMRERRLKSWTILLASALGWAWCCQVGIVSCHAGFLFWVWSFLHPTASLKVFQATFPHRSYFSSLSDVGSLALVFWFFFFSFNCWCEVEKQRQEVNGGKLNWEERTNFHILCPVLLRFVRDFRRGG